MLFVKLRLPKLFDRVRNAIRGKHYSFRIKENSDWLYQYQNNQNKKAIALLHYKAIASIHL